MAHVDLRAILRAYCDRGWYLFPVKRATKLPHIKNFLEDASNDIEDLMRWAERFPNCNWGLACSKSGVVVVDIDAKGLDPWQALEFQHGEPQTLRARSGSGVGSHYFFKAKSRGKIYRGKLTDGIDVKHNGFVCVYPSVHDKTGKRYRFVNDAKITKVPGWLAKLIVKDAAKTGKASNVYGFAGSEWYRKIIDQIKEREFGHDEWVRLGMALHSAFEGSEEGEELFVELSHGASYKEGDDELARLKWASFSNKGGNVGPGTFVYLARKLGCSIPSPKLEEDKKAFQEAEAQDLTPVAEWVENSYGHFTSTDPEFIVKEINRKGFATLGGATSGRIIRHWKDEKGADQFTMLTNEHFKNALAPFSYRFRDPDSFKIKTVAASEIWRKSSKRATFRNVVFKPDADFEDLNLWADIPCKPVKGDVHLALELINVLCGGDKAKAKYFTQWLAHLMQKPWEKSITVPVIIGEQGTGKGLFTDGILARILSNFYIRFDKPGVIKERFNSEQARKFLTVLDEASWRGDHELKNIMKSLTGSHTMTVEEKFGGRYTIENYSRYMITSNDFEAVALEVSNRRYLVLEAATWFKGTKKFSQIADAARTGGLAQAFYHYLLNFDLTGFDPFAFPEKLDTGASETKVRSLGVVGEFWNEILIDDPQPILQVHDQETFLSRKYVFDLFRNFSDENRHHQKSVTPVVFWKETASIIPPLASHAMVRPRMGRDRVKGHYIAPRTLVTAFCERNRLPKLKDFDDLDYIIEGDFKE